MLKNILPLITLIFVILKMCGLITWSWWLVLSPMLFELTVLGICTSIILYTLSKIKKESGASWSQVLTMYFSKIDKE